MENLNGSLKIKQVNLSDLTAECWSVQMWGLDACNDCQFAETNMCGGAEIRKDLLENGVHGKIGVHGLPSVEPEEDSIDEERVR